MTDDRQLQNDVAALIETALESPDVFDDAEGEKLRALMRDRFTAAQLKRLEQLLGELGSLAFLEHRAASAREERVHAFSQMTDTEIRSATGGTLIGTLAFRSPFVSVDGGGEAA